MFDRFGREITSLRVSLTSACNMRCGYCVPLDGPAPRRRRLLTAEEIARACRAAVSLGIRKIRLTGGEPLVRADVLGIVEALSRIEGLDHLAMTTNGSLLAARARALRRAGLQSVNVSLDTLDAVRYARITGGGRIEEALDGIRAAMGAGLALKVNMVRLPDTTEEEIEAMRRFTAGIGARMQLIALFTLDTEKCDAAGFDRPPSCGELQSHPSHRRRLPEAVSPLERRDTPRLRPPGGLHAGGDTGKAAARGGVHEPLHGGDRRLRWH